jgi:hypothetical protein
VIQPQTQTREYWVSTFALSETDIEHLYNHFLEVETPQTVDDLARAIMANRVQQETQDVKRRLSGRTVYQPQKAYEIGEKLIFPAMKYATGEVVSERKGYNPEYGNFDVINVKINGKEREFAAGLTAEHVLNQENGGLLEQLENVDLDALFAEYGEIVVDKLVAALEASQDFIRLGRLWLVRGLLVDITIGHLHLAEAVLEMNEGGPLTTEEILPVLELDKSIKKKLAIFSLNHAMLRDDRFDEVAPRSRVAWFLRRLEPEVVKEMPERLVYERIPYDRALLSPQLLLLERELDDEWSDLEPPPILPGVVRLTLTYPHRWAGTLPMNANTRTLFDLGATERQTFEFVDEEDGTKMRAWIVQPERYISGLRDWYDRHEIPVGGLITLKPGPEPGVILLNFGRRSKRREWVRLAKVEDNQLKFELERRDIGCDYDELMIVGTDYVAAVDALWRRGQSNQRQLTSMLATIVPELASMNPQNTVHAKTIYSAVQLLRRTPPGPVFAELVRHPAFRAMGDHYWQFDPSRWQR